MKLKKIFATVLISVFILCMSFGFLGCGIMWEENIEKLNNIPKDNSYAIIKNSYAKCGDQFINYYQCLKEEIEKNIEIEGNYSCQISLVGDLCFFGMRYYIDTETPRISGVIGVASLPFLENIQFLYTMPTVEVETIYEHPDFTPHAFDNYIIFEYDNNAIAVDYETLKTTEVFANGYKLMTEAVNTIVYTNYSKEEKTTTFRVFDINLKEYSFAVEGQYDIYRYNVIYDNYFFFDKEDGYYTKCVNVNTGTLVDNVQELYNEYVKPSTNKGDRVLELSYGNYSLIVKNPKETSEDINYTNAEMTFTNLETEEKTVLTIEELLQNSPDLQRIIEIFPSILYSGCGVCNGELMIIFSNNDNAWGGATPKSAPRIVFRFDLVNKKLDYINFVDFSYEPIEKIMKI